MMKNYPLFLVATCVALIAVFVSFHKASAQEPLVKAGFTDGNGAGSVDQFPGITGLGWSGGWSTLAAGDLTHDSNTPTVTTAAPLNAGGNYLKVCINNENVSPQTYSGGGIGRQYVNYAALDPIDHSQINLARVHRVEFDYRVDSKAGWGSGDAINIFDSFQMNPLLQSGSDSWTWLIRVLGASQGGGVANKWAVYNGPRNGAAYDAARLVDTGMAVVDGHVYHITVDIRPATRTWAVRFEDVTAGTSTALFDNLGFNDNDTAAAGRLIFSGQMSTVNDEINYSVDGIAIGPVTRWVDSSVASTGNGTRAHPFKTISEAVPPAGAALQPGDMVVIRKGIYREKLSFTAEGTADDLITICSAKGDEGAATIKGSAVITSAWVAAAGNLPFTYITNWPTATPSWPWNPALPSGWTNYGPYCRRGEMLFVDGQPLLQVLSTGELDDLEVYESGGALSFLTTFPVGSGRDNPRILLKTLIDTTLGVFGSSMFAGTFYLDPTGQTIYVRLRSHQSPSGKTVEASVRQIGLKMAARYVKVKGLRVMHVGSDFATVMAGIELGGAPGGSGNNILEKNIAEWNNRTGIRFGGPNVMVRDNIAHHNGGMGFDGNIRDSVMEANITDYNSWRYGPDWHSGGVKLMGSRPYNNLILSHISRGNNGPGFWVDTGGKCNIIARGIFLDNVGRGVSIEATQENTVVIHNIVGQTRIIPTDPDWIPMGVGVSMRDSLKTHVYNNTIYGNQRAGILFGGGERNPDGIQTWMKEGRFYNNIVTENGLNDSEETAPGHTAERYALRFWLFDNPPGAPNPIADETTSVGNFNLYYDGPSGDGKLVKYYHGTGHTDATLAQWQTSANGCWSQDTASQEADPLFATVPGTSIYDFRLVSASPATTYNNASSTTQLRTHLQPAIHDALSANGAGSAMIAQADAVLLADLVGRTRPGAGTSLDLGAWERPASGPSALVDDNFENYSHGATLLDRPAYGNVWTTAPAPASLSVSDDARVAGQPNKSLRIQDGRSGGAAGYLPDYKPWQTWQFADQQSNMLKISFDFLAATPGDSGVHLAVQNGTGIRTRIYIRDQQVTAYANGAHVTVASNLQYGVWHHVEISELPASGTGTYKAKVDSQTQITNAPIESASQSKTDRIVLMDSDTTNEQSAVYLDNLKVEVQ